MPNWVGDVVMATPAVRALRKLAGPNGTLVGVMRPYVAEVLAGSPWFDETILYAKKSKDSSLAWPTVRRRLRDARFDKVVLLTNSLRTGWMAFRSGAPQRVGTAGNLRSLLLTTRVAPSRNALPAIDGYLQVADAAGCTPEPPTLELHTTAVDERLADGVWQRLNLPHERSHIAVLNTGGAFGAAKDWSAERFAELAGALSRKRGLCVVVNCGPAERERARQIVALAGDGRVTSLADEPDLPIGLTKAVIRRAGLLVTTDSGPRFFGVAFGVPTVSLFGPTSTELTKTYAAHEAQVSLGLDCQPCMKPVCPLVHHRCMKDLAVVHVFAAIERLLDCQTSRQAVA